MPILTRSAAEPATFRRHLADAVVAIWVFAIAVIVGLGCFADVIVTLLAGPEGFEFLFGTGTPLNEAIVYGGPFVMTTPEQMVEAKGRYSRGEMGRLGPYQG